MESLILMVGWAVGVSVVVFIVESWLDGREWDKLKAKQAAECAAMTPWERKMEDLRAEALAEMEWERTRC